MPIHKAQFSNVTSYDTKNALKDGISKCIFIADNCLNRQIQMHNITVRKGCHVDASITQSSHNPQARPAYEVINDREERDDDG